MKSNPPLTPPAPVVANLRRGLDLEQRGYGGPGLRRETVRAARRMVAGGAVTPAHARVMRAWLVRHDGNEPERARRMSDPTSPAAVAWLLWGGTPHRELDDNDVWRWLARILPPAPKHNRAPVTAAPQLRVQQADHPVFGSVGIVEEPGKPGTLYRFLGGVWTPVEGAQASYRPRRGRFDGNAPAALLEPLAAASLGSGPNDLWAYLTRLPDEAFGGTRTELPRDPAVAAIVDAARAERCLGERPGARLDTLTPSRHREAYLKAQNVRRVMVNEVCGAGDSPIPEGSVCDRTLEALELMAPPSECGPATTRCPRWISPERRNELRLFGLGPVGPYETTKPHAAGADPCCWYHPNTQARLQVQQEATQGLAEHTPEWVEAVRRAEQAHPLHAVWERCDLDAREAVGTVASDKGGGGYGAMELWRAFWDAMQTDQQDEGRVLFARLEAAGAVNDDFDTLWQDDGVFWEHAHAMAHESGSPQWVSWAHRAMGAARVAAAHALDAAGRPAPRKAAPSAAAPLKVHTWRKGDRTRVVAIYPSRGQSFRVGVRSVGATGWRRAGKDLTVKGLDRAERAARDLGAELAREGFTEEE